MDHWDLLLSAQEHLIYCYACLVVFFVPAQVASMSQLRRSLDMVCAVLSISGIIGFVVNMIWTIVLLLQC
jgi:hypothetical protein